MPHPQKPVAPLQPQEVQALTLDYPHHNLWRGMIEGRYLPEGRPVAR
jgi:hypothetical protein